MDKNLKSRNRAVALGLLAFITIVFVVTIAKMHFFFNAG